jgi:hypothetical protein
MPLKLSQYPSIGYLVAYGLSTEQKDPSFGSRLLRTDADTLLVSAQGAPQRGAWMEDYPPERICLGSGQRVRFTNCEVSG